jgi:hypothetical protein
VENRTALLAVGIFLIIAGALLTPFLCGVGVLFVVIGAVMWAAED